MNPDEFLGDFNQTFPDIDAAKNFSDWLVNSVRDHVNFLITEIEARVAEPVEQSREFFNQIRDSWTAWFNNAYEQFREVFIHLS